MCDNEVMPNKTNTKETPITPKYTDYKESYVAFIDILGFKSKILKIKDEQTFLATANLLAYSNELARLMACEDNYFYRNMDILPISDSIIITFPVDDRDSEVILSEYLVSLQRSLLLDFGVLVRGYLTKGKCYHQDGIVLGPAYIEACEKEKSIGYEPRIVVCPEFIESTQIILGNDQPQFILHTLKQDPSDGLYFIDYLKPYFRTKNVLSLKPSFRTKDTQNKFFQDIDKFIKKNLEDYKNSPSIYKKYKWLEGYLNISMKTKWQK